MATSEKSAQPARVDRAVASARAAVAQLIQLLCDEDRATFDKAAGALAEIGPFAVGPLAAALPRAGTPRERLVIIGALVTFAQQCRVPVMRALHAALRRERDPHVRAAVQAALAPLIMADLMPGRDLGPGGPEPVPAAGPV